MSARLLPKYILAVLLPVLLGACSTTRVLGIGEYRLAGNEVEIVGDEGGELRPAQISPYIRQKPNSSIAFGWNPFLSIYNWSGSSDGFFARVCRKVGEAPVVYNASMVEASKENILGHLSYLGYYDSGVEGKVSVKGRKAYVRYIVTPGRRVAIDRIKYVLPEEGSFSEEFLADTASITVREGDLLSEQALEKESARSAAYFRTKGYFELNKNRYSFVADTVSAPGTTILEYCVKPPVTKFTIGEVSISHAKSLPFKEKVLKGLNTIQPGDLYNERNVSTTYNRLSALRVFNSVGIEMNKADSSTVDCSIMLSRSQTQGFKANLEVSSNSSGLLGISPQLSFYHKNIFHGGEWLNLAFVGNFQQKMGDDVHSNEFGMSTGLSFPRFLGLPYSIFKSSAIPRTEFNASFNYQNRPEYTRNIIAFSSGYSGVFLKTWSYQFYPIQLNFVRLYNLDPRFSRTLDRNPFLRYTYQDHFDAGVGGTLYHTTNPDIVPQTSYHYSRLSVDLSGNVIGLFKDSMRKASDGTALIGGAPFTQYVRSELSLGRTVRFGEDDSWAFATRILAGVGYAYGNSTALPYEKQFYCGGANSLRGWQARAAGPGYSKMNKSFSIPSQTGDVKLEANAELRFRMFWKIEGALFADCGNIWSLQYDDPVSRFDINDFQNSLCLDTGIGIRVNLGFILLRLDAGTKTHDPSRAEGERWIAPYKCFKSNNSALHFGVGYPF